MRGLFSGLVLVSLVGTSVGQTLRNDERVAPRYGISGNVEFYPQGTAKEALASTAKAYENKRYEYIVAHLLDPALVDTKVNEAAKKLEPGIEKEFDAVRVEQKKYPERFTSAQMMPLEPNEFSQRVKTEATARGFKKVVTQITDALSESPENVMLLSKFARDGVLSENGPTATVTVKSEPSLKVFLKQADVVILRDARNAQSEQIVLMQKSLRWHIEDRMYDEPKANAGK
jgi:hypothetical protein